MSELEQKMFGKDLFGHAMRPASSGPIAERYVACPFSVLDGKHGDWQTRKKAWKRLGIRSEEGREVKTDPDSSVCALEYSVKSVSGGAGSLFDPVLAELMYLWFAPEDGQVVDPFAGGSVRGIVAAMTGRRYWGCDLSAVQIDANREQAETICTDVPDPKWEHGDALVCLPSAPDADFLFSCPPYHDLEIYSDDERDLCNMDWPDFCSAYTEIIRLGAEKLRNDRFACFVVSQVRDRNGAFHDLVGTTIRAFENAGLAFYNDAVLLTPPGSASVRVAKVFEAGRKLIRVHQNVLIFLKGDAKRATAACVRTKDEDAEWQKGYPLDELKRNTAPFRTEHKPHCYGAFELLKERDVATAMAADRYNGIPVDAPRSAAVFRVLGPRGKRFRDFRGEEIILNSEQPTLYVSSFAPDGPKHGRELLATILERYAGHSVYVETFTEHESSTQTMSQLDMEPRYFLVRSGSELKTIWTNHDPSVPWLYEPIEWMTLVRMHEWDGRPITIEDSEIAAINQELANANVELAQHYSNYNKRKSWTALSLIGFDDDPQFIQKPAEMSKRWKWLNADRMDARPRQTLVAEKCPATMMLAKRLLGDDRDWMSRVDRLRFMRLAPKKGELSRHADITDREAGVQPGKIVRLHVPLETNDRVLFTAWQADGVPVTLHCEKGGVYYLDQRKPHTVKNEGRTPRTHLVIDAVVDSHLKAILGSTARENPIP